MVAVHTCDDVCTPQAHLVEIGQVTFRADQDEWPRIVVLDGHEGTVDGTKHELHGFGVLLLTEREVAVRGVRLGRRYDLDREPEAELLHRGITGHVDASALVLRQHDDP